jgi:hypothetical protein
MRWFCRKATSFIVFVPPALQEKALQQYKILTCGGFMIPRQVAFITVFILTIFVLNAMAADSDRFKFLNSAKSNQKQNVRWTLEDWLAQKERNRMMDLWLAMYAPSPYEFYISGAWQDHQSVNNQVESDQRSGSVVAAVGAYATVLGLTGEYQNNTQEKTSDSAGALNLRLAGNAVQGTHLIGFYGNRNRQFERNGNSYYLRNQFYGGDLNIYLNKHFGLGGKYTQFLPTDDSDLGKVQGDVIEYGLFIDFSSLRLTGSFYKETQKEILNNLESLTEKKGSRITMTLFF